LHGFITYDPAPTLARLRLPVLALIGEKDLQVPASQNIPALQAALAGDAKAEVAIVPGVNHLFQTAATGAPAEYGRITETFSPAVIERIVAFARTNSR
jgi:hypothetical protein